MSQLDLEAVNPIAAQLNKIRAIAVTTSSAETNLSNSTEIWTDVQDGRMIRLRADGGDIYYAFHHTTGGSIDNTNTTQGNATQCDVIPSGDFIDVRPPFVEKGGTNVEGLCKFLLLKGSVACTLRISVTSESPHKKMT